MQRIHKPSRTMFLDMFSAASAHQLALLRSEESSFNYIRKLYTRMRPTIPLTCTPSTPSIIGIIHFKHLYAISHNDMRCLACICYLPHLALFYSSHRLETVLGKWGTSSIIPHKLVLGKRS